jgi:hypothetical protein
MRKLLSIILAMVLLPIVALADLPDVTGMSDQELKDMIAACSHELMSRNTSEPEGTLIFEYEGVKVYQIGDPYFDFSGFLRLPVAVYNDTDCEMVISPQETHCNGWDISAGNCRATGKAKNKDDIYFEVSDADVTSIDQILNFDFKWQLYDFTNYKVVYLQETKEEHRFW